MSNSIEWNRMFALYERYRSDSITEQELGVLFNFFETKGNELACEIQQRSNTMEDVKAKERIFNG